MNRLTGFRQQAVFLGLLLAMGLAAQLLYPVVNPQWIAFRAGEKAFQKHDFVQAAQAYQKALDLGVPTGEAARRLGESYLAAGRYDQARDALSRLAPGQRIGAGVTLPLARLHQQLGRPELALELYAQAEKHRALTAAESAHRGDLFRDAGQYDLAEQVFGRALAADPAAGGVLLRLAEMLAWQKRYDEAQALLERALAADPGMVQARLHLARVLAWQGRNRQAIDQYRLALGEKP